MKNILTAVIICLLGTNLHSQTISDVLENALGGVVTVAVITSDDNTSEVLGYRGTESNEAYEKALDLSGFTGSGSGFLVEVDGTYYVITNAHVVESLGEAEENLVVFSITRRKYQMKVVGGDTFYDIAVLAFITPPGKEMVPLKFRQSEIRIGEQVYAIGNPLGEFPYSVSDGIVSAKNRVRNSPTGKFGFLQTTATVIWGNSGGPLIDSKGEVVGVNSQLYATAQGNQVYIQPQINFALEASITQKILHDVLTNKGMVVRAYLGIEFSQDYQDLSWGGGSWVPYDSLPVITAILPGSPAGSLPADITGSSICGINGTEIETMEEVLAEMEKIKPGAKVDLEILQDGRRQHVYITAQKLELPQLNTIGSYFFESVNQCILTTTSDGGVSIKGCTSSKPVNTGYSTKNKTEMAGSKTNTADQSLVAAGLLYENGDTLLWRINSVSDLGAVLRLCGPYGFITLQTKNPQYLYGRPEYQDFYFSPEKGLRKVVWY